MELKVWVDGVVRVVCGLTLSTSCKDVVIALAQSLGNYFLLPVTARFFNEISPFCFIIGIFKAQREKKHPNMKMSSDSKTLTSSLKTYQEEGLASVVGDRGTSCLPDPDPRLLLGQTGRYILVMKLQESEWQLEADDCPLQQLAQLGQLSAEVQFTLWRTGPSLDQGPNTRPRSRGFLQLRAPHKASGSSTDPRRSNPNRSWSPSPQASPEPRASPLFFLNQTSSKEEVFRHILQQQQRLQELQVLLQGLERETALWEAESTSGPNPTPVEELEEQLRQNEAELLLGEQWEEELQAETDRERGTRATFLPSSCDVCEPHLFCVMARAAARSAADPRVPGG